ncbi:uncharacterized protein LOC144352901, partial [Saccoglossus kowalevskii]
MAIIPVLVKANGGTIALETYAFLDPGSSVSFCTESLMRKLGAGGNRAKITIDTMGIPHTMNTFIIKGLEVSDLNCTNTVKIPLAYTKDRMPVSLDHMATKDDISRWPHLCNIDLPKINADVGLLIGNGVPDAYTPVEILTGPRGSPHAARTMLGWIIWNVVRESCGEMLDGVRNCLTVNRAIVVALEAKEELKQLDQLVRSAINMDFPERNLDDRKECSQKDKAFVEKVNSSMKFVDGHYEIGLPFRRADVQLPDNKAYARQRLKGIEKRLRIDAKFHSHYKAFMEDIIQKKYAVRVPSEMLDRNDGKVWFIPHHGVYHPNKPDKIRVVFDCSAKWLGLSLNDLLLQGPDLTNSLLGVLMRFRQEPVAVMADIEAMFHQVKVPEDDMDCLRFYWWPDGDLSRNPEVCFNLTKWVSNSHAVLESVPNEARAKNVKQLDLSRDHLPTQRALGVHWKVEPDALGFQINIQDKPPTRRGILSVVSSVFDPIGLAAPFILPGKILLQELCHQGIGWDDEINKKDLQKWHGWEVDLPQLKKISVPRCFKPVDFGKVVSCQVHNFSDASERGYGMVSYLRLHGSHPILCKQDHSVSYICCESPEGTDVSQWRYVNTKDNPADYASRGLRVDDTIHRERWLNGPGFLWNPQSQWPRCDVSMVITCDDPEVKREVNTVIVSRTDSGVDRILSYFSSWMKLKVEVAWILTAKNNLQHWVKKRKELRQDVSKTVMDCNEIEEIVEERKKALKAAVLTHSKKVLKHMCLTVDALHKAECTILGYVQGKCFSEEIKDLTSGQHAVKH